MNCHENPSQPFSAQWGQGGFSSVCWDQKVMAVSVSDKSFMKLPRIDIKKIVLTVS